MLGDFHDVFEFLLDKPQPLDAIEKMWDERPRSLRRVYVGGIDQD